MSGTISVCCATCGQRHRYTAPSYPCVCGAPVAPALDLEGTATPVTRRVWEEEWIAVRCAVCAVETRWPRPEVGCPCGTVLCVPLERAPAGGAVRSSAPGVSGGGAGGVRAALDAVTAAVLRLRGLGHLDVRPADWQPRSGLGLAAHGVVAQVDPAAGPASARDVECLWLRALAESAACVHFSLAGPTDEARARAEHLGVPLFVLDRTGTPRPVNGPARALEAGADRPPGAG